MFTKNDLKQAFYSSINYWSPAHVCFEENAFENWYNIFTTKIIEEEENLKQEMLKAQDVCQSLVQTLNKFALVQAVEHDSKSAKEMEEAEKKYNEASKKCYDIQSKLIFIDKLKKERKNG